MPYIRGYLDWAEVGRLAPASIASRENALGKFAQWAEERAIAHPGELTRPMLEAYQRWLYLYRKPNGKPLALGSQEMMIVAVKGWCKWLARERHILSNPASELELPRKVKSLPKVLLSVEQVEHLMQQPRLEEITGVRDRAILELLYSTGLRRSEAIHLQLQEVDCLRGTAIVRRGKGGKDRVVPIGARALYWLKRYLEEVRPQLVSGLHSWTLFLTDYGEPYEKNRLSGLVKRYLRDAGIEHGSCHALRHACATHMLENGADVRFIQALLGHSHLSTTEIYTHVAIGKLIEVHRLTHPARLEKAQLLKALEDEDEDSEKSDTVDE